MDIQWLLQKPQEMTAAGKGLPAPLALKAGDLLVGSVLAVEKGNDALLAFGGFKAYARLPQPVVSGQDVHIRVESAGEGLRMVMVPGNNGPSAKGSSGGRWDIHLFEPVSDKPFFSAPPRLLTPGQSLQGRITGFEKDGLTLVDFGKFKAFAKIDIPVRQGQALALNVVKNDNGIALVVAPSTPSVAAPVTLSNQAAVTTQRTAASPVHQVRPAMPSPPAAHALSVGTGLSAAPNGTDMALLREEIQGLLTGTNQPKKVAPVPLSIPMKAALVNLQQALDPVSMGGDTPTLVARVRDFVENSGIYFEKRLEAVINTLQARPTPLTPTELAGTADIRELMAKDLKPNLLVLKQFLDTQPLESQGTDRHLLETLKSVTQRAVSHIEQQQFMATEKPVDPDLFQAFSHLMFLADQQRHAQLKVYYAKKGCDGHHKNPRISLLLNMDRMGTVRTDLWMVGRDLNITFFVQEAEIKAAIEQVHHHIGRMLKDTFNTVAVSVVVSNDKITEFEGEDLTVSDHRQVDLNV